ncbi:proteasome-type protease [Thioalkalivibrio paradoxus]|uniref:Proteasome-type protease n=1 Tax=Thioalkalivibrio paradoxus ARh 1 TaxID=713585 RepID=W0DP08_9GAMM|nr:proteasome-type protease [Thioalkalivibrio paradoxus]AHE98997.1 proteasome-type protease [Thioalkalivibrio paradoxus ARh 1]
MTYCVAIKLDEGLVFASDSRTNAGVDQVSTYSKMHSFETDGERLFIVLTAGNLATTQAVVNRLKREMEEGVDGSFADAVHMSDAAEYLGRVNREEQEKHSEALSKSGIVAEATLLLGGQIRGGEPEIYRVYPQGNYITTSQHTPFLQIGESKYGKPILDRILAPSTPLGDAARCALVSIDSTMRSNLTVGPPIEVLVYETDSFAFEHYLCLEADDAYLRSLTHAWDENIRKAFVDLPRFDWETAGARKKRGTHVHAMPGRGTRKNSR